MILRRLQNEASFGELTPKGIRPIVIPDWPEVPVFIIKNNLRSGGLSREKYFKLLESV
jgi:hypothetical protein